MAIEGQTTANFPTEIRDFYDRVALRKAVPLITFRKWGQKRTLPRIVSPRYSQETKRFPIKKRAE